MALYVYKCGDCGVFERVIPIREHANIVACECGKLASQVITRPQLIIPKDINYKSPIDGTPITSEKAWREDMARNNCIEYDPGMRQDVDRRLKESDAALDKIVDETVDREIALMPTAKRERLESELTQGLTAEVARL